MNRKSLVLYTALLLGGFFLSSSVLKEPAGSSHDIWITVTNVRNTKGTMQFQVYRSQKAFAAETPYKTYRVTKKSNVKSKKMSYKIKGLASGNYGVALLDDENSNKKMDYSWMTPKEGFGFSNYYHTAWSKPTFYKFKFYLKGDKGVTMKIRYM